MEKAETSCSMVPATDHTENKNETSFMAAKSHEKEVRGNRKDDKLGKELSLIHGVGIIVGSIIGSGIFISPNGVLEEAGSYGMALIMWVIGGLLATGGGLCFCELGNFVKKSGSEYAYIKEGFSFNNRNYSMMSQYWEMCCHSCLFGQQLSVFGQCPLLSRC